MAVSLRTAGLTGATLLAFAGNSLLCRAAMAPRLVDAASFTAIRLASGAAALAILARATGAPERRGGSWASALALFVYAAAFSFAYVRIGAGVGALVLFGCVQATMIGWGLARGERLHAAEVAGLVIALGGLAALTLPGAHAVDVPGAGLMALAGIGWGAYSLRGRGAVAPVAANADNFLRSLPFVVALAVAGFSASHVTWRGAALAATSGALASGVGYSLWYAALRGLTAARAAIVQLAVPVLAALGGVALLGESLTPRLGACGAAILGGVAVALLGRR